MRIYANSKYGRLLTAVEEMDEEAGTCPRWTTLMP